jgi:hypothetical protein
MRTSALCSARRDGSDGAQEATHCRAARRITQAARPFRTARCDDDDHDADKSHHAAPGGPPP